MDLTTAMVVFLTHLIMLDFNSAESGDSDTTAADESTTPYIPSRFTWPFSKGPETSPGAVRRNQVSAETDDEDDPQGRVVYWIPTTCDSLSERGYTCVGCGESLHCMAGNFALKAICYGRRPYCHNGVCSYIRGEKCQSEGQQTHIANPTIQAVDPSHVQGHPVDPNIQMVPANATFADDVEAIEDTMPANITGDIVN